MNFLGNQPSKQIFVVVPTHLHFNHLTHSSSTVNVLKLVQGGTVLLFQLDDNVTQVVGLST